MGEIVAAMATCHAPQLLTYPPDEDPAQLDSTIAAMRELGLVLDETQPDVLIVLGSDHLETFSLTCAPTFAMIAGNRAVARFAGREYDVPVHREMAEDILEKLVRADFDIAYSEDAVLGHAFAVPFEYILADRNIPVIPFHTNVYLPPLPNPRRCAALGQQIAQTIADRPERVAILASGGMSHYPGTWKYPHPEFAFDHWMIEQLENGNSDALLDMTVEQLDEVGNTELLSWSVLLGAIGNAPARLLQYTPTWHHGHAMMQFLPSSPKTSSGASSNSSSNSGPETAKYGGFEFQNQGFAFYKHPAASAYNLNKLLYDIRQDAGLRRELLTNLPSVAATYSLTDQEVKAADAIAHVGEAERISDCADLLVEAGAHPLHALMSLHAVHGEYRKMLRNNSES